jgi:deoxyribose-phosphate aldolase
MNTSQEILNPSPHQLASIIEHTLLDKDIDENRLNAHIDEAIELDVLGVCIPMAFIPLAKKRLSDCQKIVVSVIDFPLGTKSSLEKANEAKAAKLLGADELDMVMDYQALIAKDYDKVLWDINAVVEEVFPLPIKVIVETSALNKAQLAIACALTALSHAAYIKTSTGFHKGGALALDIAFMKELLPKRILIKASGGIRDYQSALAMVKAGAHRIGTSKTKNILQG